VKGLNNFCLLEKGKLDTQPYKPFWNETSQLISKKIWLPQASDVKKASWSSWDGYTKSMEQKSWFTTKITIPKFDKNYKKFSKQIPVPRVNIKEKKKNIPNSCKTVKLQPTKDQERLLNKWLGDCRWTHNKAIDSQLKTENELKEAFITNKSLEKDQPWLANTPAALRYEVICHLARLYKSNSSIKYRSKKDEQQSLPINNKSYKKVADGFTFFSHFFVKEKVSPIIKVRGELPDVLNYDSLIVKDSMNEWYLKYPTIVKCKDLLDDNQVPCKRICALDPGLRTFQTIYDLNGALIEIGAQDQEKILRLCFAADALFKKREDTTGKKRYKYRKSYQRIMAKINHLMDEIHNKVIKFLVLNYNLIYLPIFDNEKMFNNKAKLIKSPTVQNMTTWSHNKFMTKLKKKAYIIRHCKVYVSDEAYTSKTCTQCGKINYHLGANKAFKCTGCDLKIDRDFNGARNILIKNLLQAPCF
jgi:putative transposase